MLLKSGLAVTLGLTLALLSTGTAQAGTIWPHRCWHHHHRCYKPHHRDNGHDRYGYRVRSNTHDRGNAIHGKDNGHDKGNAIHDKDNGHDKGNAIHDKDNGHDKGNSAHTK